jgi:hypothetical protein
MDTHPPGLEAMTEASSPTSVLGTPRTPIANAIDGTTVDELGRQRTQWAAPAPLT